MSEFGRVGPKIYEFLAALGTDYEKLRVKVKRVKNELLDHSVNVVFFWLYFKKLPIDFPNFFMEGHKAMVWVLVS